MSNTTAFIFVAILTVLLVAIPLVMFRKPQSANTVLMVEPTDFAYNPFTAKTNAFSENTSLSKKEITKKAMTEFNNMVKKLRANGIIVITMKSNPQTKTPDAVFPSNWFSTLRNRKGEVILVLYPMFDYIRRAERQENELSLLLKSYEIDVTKTINLSFHETEDRALEGTGSIVFDHEHQIGFVSLSERSDEEITKNLFKEINYTPIFFHSYHDDQPVYHTNVVLSIGTNFAVLCADCIYNGTERTAILKRLKALGKEIILITQEQMKNMCGNILELQNMDRELIIVISKRAHRYFTEKQLQQLQNNGKLVIVDLDVIERVGGGSARCMMAEIFH